eukprot:m.12553 g.12553  ORF g.12553 m.12553 type:complete len:619 (+) comp24128_c0_seq1:17-1873(+)
MSLDFGRRRKKHRGREASEDELLVFGYACKLFRDDEKAFEVERMLIPWNGDDDLLISRYDVRAQFTDEAEFAMEGPFDEEKSPEEEEIERLCNEERLRDLQDAEETEEELEEKAKRNNQVPGYQAVGFEYKDAERIEEENMTDSAPINREALIEEEEKENDDQDAPYEAPEGLSIPDGIELPQTQKAHSIIEKTAQFVGKQGLQMEIMIKAKQASNPQFDFLSFGNPLNLYYKSVVENIKDGTYTPAKPDNKSSNTENGEEEEDDDEEYSLHPSLFAKPKPQKTDSTATGPKNVTPMLNALAPVTLKMSDSSHSSSPLRFSGAHQQKKQPLSALVSFERDAVPILNPVQDKADWHFQQLAATNKAPVPVQSKLPPWHTMSYVSCLENSSDLDSVSIPPPPPDDVQAVIDKLAAYVVKNGCSFESVVAQKGNPKFAFLTPTHMYNGYYNWKKQELEQQFGFHVPTKAEPLPFPVQPEAEVNKIEVIRVTAVRPSAAGGAKKVMNEKADGLVISPEKEEEEEEDMIEPIKEIFVKEGGFEKGNSEKSKQLERKRKAALLVARIKQEQAKKERNGRHRRSRDSSRSASPPSKRSHSDSSPRRRHHHHHHRHHHQKKHKRHT